MSDTSQGPGWWQASDGKWYAPESATSPPPPPPPMTPSTSESDDDLGDEEGEDDEEEVDDSQSDSKRKVRQKKVRYPTFTHAQYLGGLPGTKNGVGNLIFAVDAVGVGTLSPKKGVVAWADMAGISFDSTTMAKSRVGKALAFGVFALAAKSTQNGAEITILRKDGNAAMYMVTGKTGMQVRAKVQPFLIERGVPCLDDPTITATLGDPVAAPSVPAASPSTASTADEIAKLVTLRDSGAITDEEFTAYKANLMN